MLLEIPETLVQPVTQGRLGILGNPLLALVTRFQAGQPETVETLEQLEQLEMAEQEEVEEELLEHAARNLLVHVAQARTLVGLLEPLVHLVVGPEGVDMEILIHSFRQGQAQVPQVVVVEVLVLQIAEVVGKVLSQEKVCHQRFQVQLLTIEGGLVETLVVVKAGQRCYFH